MRGAEEEGEKEEKIPHLCESIDHRPFWGRCPAPSLIYNLNLLKQGTGTADHLTLLRQSFTRSLQAGYWLPITMCDSCITSYF